MKAFAFVLLCALAAVQGRYTAIQSTRDLTDLDENPWLVHLRIAVSTSGLLNTGAGSLIAANWVLTTAENIANGRFVWVRYGVVDVTSPSLVTETSAVSINPSYNPTTGENNIGLINLNRNVVSTPNIAPVTLISAADFGSGEFAGKVCIFGPPGVLHCFRINWSRDDNAGLGISDPGKGHVTDHDYGTPVISENGQIGLLVGSDNEDSVGEYIAIDVYFDWIQAETGVILNPEPLPDADPAAVHFVQ